ncbi:hypothetical protein AB0D33_19735, partial [Streptomyces sp. NPDC048404]|uniref:hypothetical protein n=1 Tax=Streptomyces sp. NPDC048404 TaxID=3154721 RepID=UPI0034177DEF
MALRTELMCGKPSERRRATAGSTDARPGSWPRTRRRGAVADRGTVVRIPLVRQYAITGGSARACGPGRVRGPREPTARFVLLGQPRPDQTTLTAYLGITA